MYTFRTPYPPANQLCALGIEGGTRWVAIGDVSSIVRGMPWLPEMGRTKRRTIGHRSFVNLQALQGWCDRLAKSEYKDAARDLQRVVDWAKTVTVSDALPTAGKQKS